MHVKVISSLRFNSRFCLIQGSWEVKRRSDCQVRRTSVQRNPGLIRNKFSSWKSSFIWRYPIFISVLCLPMTEFAGRDQLRTTWLWPLYLENSFLFLVQSDLWLKCLEVQDNWQQMCHGIRNFHGLQVGLSVFSIDQSVGPWCYENLPYRSIFSIWTIEMDMNLTFGIIDFSFIIFLKFFRIENSNFAESSFQITMLSSWRPESLSQ